MNKTRKISVLALVLILALTLTACSNQGKVTESDNQSNEGVEEEKNDGEVEKASGTYEAVNLKDNEQGVFSFEGKDLVFTPDNSEVEVLKIPIENSEFKKHEGEASYQLIIVTNDTEEHEFSGLYEEFFDELEKHK